MLRQRATAPSSRLYEQKELGTQEDVEGSNTLEHEDTMLLTTADLFNDANELLKKRGATFVLNVMAGRGTLTLVSRDLDKTKVIEGDGDSIKTYLAAFTTGFRIGDIR